MLFSDFDINMMQQALQLAAFGKNTTSPNPRVGCVITQGSNIVGQGFHVQAGSPHAEVHALRQAAHLAKGATAYVTLEPCSHFGKTPPCAQALVNLGVKQVIIAMTDPNPLVAGNGIKLLEQAGILVKTGLLETEARELNRGFLYRIERKRPFVKVKIASSLDGKTALANGASKWITGQDARNDVQLERACSCAVLTGIETIIADNPQLNVRLENTLRQPLRVILDSQLRINLSSQILQDNQPVLIVTQHHHAEKITALKALGADVLIQNNAASNRIDLPLLLTELAHRQIGELMIEAGATLSSAFLAENLVDELIWYQAPKILGADARPAINLPAAASVLEEQSVWKTSSISTIGHDIKWVLRYQSKHE